MTPSSNPTPPRLDAEELRRLRAIAEAAIGDWSAVQIGVGGGMRATETVPAYIAAFKPQTALALLDTLAQPTEGGSGGRWRPIEEAPREEGSVIALRREGERITDVVRYELQGNSGPGWYPLRRDCWVIRDQPFYRDGYMWAALPPTLPAQEEGA